MGPGDLILAIDGAPVPSVEALAAIMKILEEKKPGVVVLHVMRGIHTFYIELEPKWDQTEAKG